PRGRLVGPEDGDELGPCSGPDPVRGQVGEEEHALSPRELLLEPAPRDLDRDPSAKLDPRRFHRLQLCCNLLAKRWIDNGRADPRRLGMAKIINCECGYVA